MNCLFVTGTDTAVGKTVVSRALLQKFAASWPRVVGYKPVAKGSQLTDEGWRNKDALVLQSASSVALPYEKINPFPLPEEEISAHQSARIDFQQLTAGLATLQQQADVVVVEGTGGWRSLMSDRQPLSSWVIAQNIPVVLVIGIKPGCISHALLTAEAITGDGLPLIGWVANRINPCLPHYAEMIAVLQERIAAPMLGEIPYLPRAEQRDLADYLDLSPLQLAATA